MQFALGGHSGDVLASVRFSHYTTPKITVSNFVAIPAFIHGTKLVATQAEQIPLASLKSLDMADLPFETDKVSMSMVWYERSSDDPSHKWLRKRIMNQVLDIGLM